MCSGLVGPLGLQCDRAEILLEHFAMSHSCPQPKARRKYGKIVTRFGGLNLMDLKMHLRGDSGNLSLTDCHVDRMKVPYVTPS